MRCEVVIRTAGAICVSRIIPLKIFPHYGDNGIFLDLGSVVMAITSVVISKTAISER